VSFLILTNNEFIFLYRRTETEINERLQDVHNKLLQAGADRKETEREASRKECFAALQRIFPGVLPNPALYGFQYLSTGFRSSWSRC
jgi:hypothetical protein